jgi:PAS domain S-box-containing protein
MIREIMKDRSQEILRLHSRLLKEAEEKSRLKAELRFLLNNISSVTFSIEAANFKTLNISFACQKLCGYHADAFYQNPGLWKELLFSDDREAFGEKCKLLLTGIEISHELRITHADGSLIWVTVTVSPTLDAKGKLTHLNGILLNITEQKNAEFSVSENENKYRMLFEKTIDGIYKSSHEGKFIDVNPALVSMLGYDSKEELMAIDIKKSLYFESSDRDNAVIQDKMEGISVFRLRKKDGSEIWVEDRGQYVTDENGKILYHEGILRDVTKRVQAQLQLRKSQNETADYRKALDQSLLVSITDHKGIIIYANENFCNASGYNMNELQGQDHSILKSDYHSRQFIKSQWDIIEKGNVWRGEIKNKTKSGKFFWVEATVVPFLNENGNPYQYLSIEIDITERKAAQESILKKNNELQKTNTELDKFVYSISHDLRAPLCSIQGIINISLEDVSQPEIRENLLLINQGTRRLDVLIHDILDYSNNARSIVERVPVDFRSIFDEVINGLKCQSIINDFNDVQLIIENQKPFLSDKKRLIVILSNLIANGIMYRDPLKVKSFVRIRINIGELNTEIEVADNGIGISKARQQSVFEMFLRVSENSMGSGLGLYLVKEAVTKLEGNIQLKSDEGQGCVFTIHLPNYTKFS